MTLHPPSLGHGWNIWIQEDKDQRPVNQAILGKTGCVRILLRSGLNEDFIWWTFDIFRGLVILKGPVNQEMLLNQCFQHQITFMIHMDRFTVTK